MKFKSALFLMVFVLTGATQVFAKPFTPRFVDSPNSNAPNASVAIVNNKPEHPCRAEAKKFCSDIEPGQGRLRKCLKKHKSELSQSCQDKLKEAKKEVKTIMKTCKPERKAMCPEVKGDGEIVKCLRKNKTKLSPECKDACGKNI